MCVLYVVLVYSIILTLVQLYKYHSKYCYGPDNIDYIVSGPVMWILVLSLAVVAFIYPYLKKYFQFDSIHIKSLNKTISERKAKFIVKAVVKARKKQSLKNNEEKMLISIDKVYDSFDGILSLRDIPVSRARYEYINKIFDTLYYHQKNLLIELIFPYLSLWEKDDYIKEEFDGNWIDKYGEETFYYLK